MKQYLNKMVVMTFLHPVGFPDGSAANLVQGVITGHNDKEDTITVGGITICYRTNPLMSICLGAAEQYNDPRKYPVSATYLPAKEGAEPASAVIETTFEGVGYMIEFDGKGNIGGLVKIDGERKGWDFYFNEEEKPICDKEDTGASNVDAIDLCRSTSPDGIFRSRRVIIDCLSKLGGAAQIETICKSLEQGGVPQKIIATVSNKLYYLKVRGLVASAKYGESNKYVWWILPSMLRMEGSQYFVPDGLIDDPRIIDKPCHVTCNPRS